jgi:hypothetical protein
VDTGADIVGLRFLVSRWPREFGICGRSRRRRDQNGPISNWLAGQPGVPGRRGCGEEGRNGEAGGVSVRLGKRHIGRRRAKSDELVRPVTSWPQTRPSAPAERHRAPQTADHGRRRSGGAYEPGAVSVGRETDVVLSGHFWGSCPVATVLNRSNAQRGKNVICLTQLRLRNRPSGIARTYMRLAAKPPRRFRRGTRGTGSV